MTDAPRPPQPAGPQYKGQELEAARGPGLGCFYVQLVLLGLLAVLTPLSAFGGWPPLLTIGFMVALLALLLITGQTIIFLLRIVASERGRRRPLAARSRTVGEMEAGRAGDGAGRAAEQAQLAGDEAPRAAEQAQAAGDDEPLPADQPPPGLPNPPARGDASGMRE